MHHLPCCTYALEVEEQTQCYAYFGSLKGAHGPGKSYGHLSTEIHDTHSIWWWWLHSMWEMTETPRVLVGSTVGFRHRPGLWALLYQQEGIVSHGFLLLASLAVNLSFLSLSLWGVHPDTVYRQLLECPGRSLCIVVNYHFTISVSPSQMSQKCERLVLCLPAVFQGLPLIFTANSKSAFSGTILG